MYPLRLLISIGLVTSITFGAVKQSLPQKQPPFRPVADVEDIMRGIIEPLTRTVFSSVGAIVSQDGIQEIAPKNDKEWGAVRSAAMGLAEAGNLLMFESRTKDKRVDWMTMSQQLIDRSVDAANAAKAKNAEQLLLAGGDLYKVCESCHYQYMSYENWQEWRWNNRSPCSAAPSEVCR
jgi:hypothetical protein